MGIRFFSSPYFKWLKSDASEDIAPAARTPAARAVKIVRIGGWDACRTGDFLDNLSGNRQGLGRNRMNPNR